MRWYEMNPTVFMAISMVELAPLNVQFDCARMILKKISEENGDDYLKNIVELSKSEHHPKNRWYDRYELVEKAFDCLKHISKDSQQIVSNEVLQYLRVAA